MSSKIHPIDWKRVDILIDLALEEDLGENGDITTNSVIPADLKAKAILLAKQDLVIAASKKSIPPSLSWQKCRMVLSVKKAMSSLKCTAAPGLC